MTYVTFGELRMGLKKPHILTEKFSSFIKCQVNYTFVWNSLQESTKDDGIMTALSAYKSPVFFFCRSRDQSISGHGSKTLKRSQFMPLIRSCKEKMLYEVITLYI